MDQEPEKLSEIRAEQVAKAREAGGESAAEAMAKFHAAADKARALFGPANKGEVPPEAYSQALQASLKAMDRVNKLTGNSLTDPDPPEGE